jgi:hypothetical protein
VSKSKKGHASKSHLTAEEKKLGTSHLYLLVGMIVIGAVVGIYFLNQTH